MISTMRKLIRPRARKSDPVTSHVAAASVVDVTKKQAAVLHTLKDLGGEATDDSIKSWYKALQFHDDLPDQSDSGLRTRRRELVDEGLIVNTGQLLPTKTGRPAIVWRLVDKVTPLDDQIAVR